MEPVQRDKTVKEFGLTTGLKLVSEKSIGGIIFRNSGNKRLYLLLEYERINDKEGGHKYWDFPKGHVEKDENEIATLYREVKEETGLEKVDLILGFKEKIKYFFKKDNKLISKEVIFYLLKTEQENVKISFEHTAFKWAEFGQALKLIVFKNSKDMLNKAEKFLNNRLENYTK